MVASTVTMVIEQREACLRLIKTSRLVRRVILVTFVVAVPSIVIIWSDHGRTSGLAFGVALVAMLFGGLGTMYLAERAARRRLKELE
jgi:hypothetical protein